MIPFDQSARLVAMQNIARSSTIAEAYEQPPEYLGYQVASFAMPMSIFAFAETHAALHKDRAFQASSPKTFMAGPLGSAFFFVLRRSTGNQAVVRSVGHGTGPIRRRPLAFASSICERGEDKIKKPDRTGMVEFSAERTLTGGVERVDSGRPADHPFALFFREFLRHPAMVGSIIPSSRRTIAAMLAPVDWANTRLFVEYGPGVGTFCGTILDRLPADGTLLAIDTNPVFVDHLRRKFTDSRFIVANGSAADVNEIIAAHGFEQADYVVSGLPFSTLPAGVGEAIAEATHRALRPGGSFLVYQYSAYVLRLLEPLFESIDRDLEWWNIPPCSLFWAHKATE